ncbi:hypothetical protein PGT21_030719 [Puccinia graminis f. sp. tritici]|uniref:Uncharacterized protein n=1 Tax=Puccinia graminis f. sp. tritici TaxID=56615 RepID=A0A5B0Q4B6_PUCGR|nr:hypothetical protein PGT21_030719 [Puccinia graminis f. sp. tritici]KAA1107978.1 hypothetical protein PGTUg99_019667 [Puccinia graminis f. sp. tritici]
MFDNSVTKESTWTPEVPAHNISPSGEITDHPQILSPHREFSAEINKEVMNKYNSICELTDIIRKIHLVDKQLSETKNDQLQEDANQHLHRGWWEKLNQNLCLMFLGKNERRQQSAYLQLLKLRKILKKSQATSHDSVSQSNPRRINFLGEWFQRPHPITLKPKEWQEEKLKAIDHLLISGIQGPNFNEDELKTIEYMAGHDLASGNHLLARNVVNNLTTKTIVESRLQKIVDLQNIYILQSKVWYQLPKRGILRELNRYEDLTQNGEEWSKKDRKIFQLLDHSHMKYQFHYGGGFNHPELGSEITSSEKLESSLNSSNIREVWKNLNVGLRAEDATGEDYVIDLYSGKMETLLKNVRPIVKALHYLDLMRLIEEDVMKEESSKIRQYAEAAFRSMKRNGIIITGKQAHYYRSGIPYDIPIEDFQRYAVQDRIIDEIVTKAGKNF